MKKKYDAIVDGAIQIKFDTKPNLAGRIKIVIVNALFFPLIKITYKEE